MTPVNYTLNSITAATWTDLAAPATAAIIKSLAIRIGGTGATVSLRITDTSGTSRVLLIDTAGLAANATYTPDLAAIALNAGDKLQVKCSGTDVEFAAFGAIA